MQTSDERLVSGLRETLLDGLVTEHFIERTWPGIDRRISINANVAARPTGRLSGCRFTKPSAISPRGAPDLELS
ncbi:hypothetical protein [Pseudoduganella umbonata]|uniref:Uncharacterized protein n=1 Tax=Pseudoduganella umbonata TaxID=864828 RepID=A0A4P8HLC2_9BURK|nr:hypothetical protein [Pseudoduganella umbonata]MBB3221698.1 hypothetical protein [Pseudoduganella umbonata]QCP09080.1 hypothetical protein FCL38_00485 [Pseudoduganella umbonata]